MRAAEESIVFVMVFNVFEIDSDGHWIPREDDFAGFDNGYWSDQSP